MKAAKVEQVIEMMERLAPPSLAMEGDRIGLQIGRRDQPVETVLITLDVTEAVVDEAIKKEAGLILSHHAFIYRPIRSIDTGTPYGRTLEKLLSHGIGVYVAHTNLDVAEGGINDMLADALNLENRAVFVPTGEVPLKKLVVFAPPEAADRIRRVLGDMGAGAIGNYSHCSFTAEGTGRFLPGEGTNPYIGTSGKLEAVPEVRIETIFPETIEKPLIDAMLDAHPYEEPAYDIYPLALPGMKYGLGRIGRLEKEMSFPQFVEYVKERLAVPAVRVVGNRSSRIRTVAVLGGDGDKFCREAYLQGADVYVTGDIYYHTAVEAKEWGINMVDCGHHAESVMKGKLAEKLAEEARKRGLSLRFLPSEVKTEPFLFM
jgi:conserved hypothetical protein TIGR00486